MIHDVLSPKHPKIFTLISQDLLHTTLLETLGKLERPRWFHARILLHDFGRDADVAHAAAHAVVGQVITEAVVTHRHT